MIDSFTGRYAFLSNFYQSGMPIDGRFYSTVEHYFQSQKTLDPKWRERIQHAPSPSEAKALGRMCPLRSDWEQVKEAVMYRALQVKFTQAYLRQRLLETGDQDLIEGNNHGDLEWGQVNGVGENKLGKLLMRLRQEIRDAMIERTIEL